MVNLYWNIGRVITQDIQKNKKRAGYGDQMIEELGRRLTMEYGQGFSMRNLWDMKRFFADFQILQSLPAESTQARISPANGYGIYGKGAFRRHCLQNLESPSSSTSRSTITWDGRTTESSWV